MNLKPVYKYNKQQLYKYTKELFMLCLEKDILVHARSGFITVYFSANEMYTSYLTEDLFNLEVFNSTIPVWKLIEKIKT